MNFPLITIAVAVYNTGKYLKDCMDSVVNQTYQNLEIICVNDCSTDNSLEILNAYSTKDERIKIINNEKNSGLGVTRNVGMDAAHGEYILFIDSDDWLDLTTCERLIAKAKENDSDIVFYSAYMVKSNHKSKMRNVCNVSTLLKFEDRKILLEKILPSTWSKLWKLEFMMKNKIRFPDFRRAQDHKVHWMGCIFAETINFIDEYLYNYRINEYQISSSSDERLLIIFDVFRDIELWLKEHVMYKDYRYNFLSWKVKCFVGDYVKMSVDIKKRFRKKKLISIKEFAYYLFTIRPFKRKMIIFVLYNKIAENFYARYVNMIRDRMMN